MRAMTIALRSVAHGARVPAVAVSGKGPTGETELPYCGPRAPTAPTYGHTLAIRRADISDQAEDWCAVA